MLTVMNLCYILGIVLLLGVMGAAVGCAVWYVIWTIMKFFIKRKERKNGR